MGAHRLPGVGSPSEPKRLIVSVSDLKQLYGYKVVAALGTGARSVLYVVQDTKSRELFTLKHVRLEDSDKDDRWLVQVEQEFEVGSKLDHPSIRGVKQVFRSREGLKFWKRVEIGLLMEFVDASSLDGMTLTTNHRAAEIFSRVAQGLAHMHDRGFVHADMKPNNILVSEQLVKIIDLGQACANGTKKKRVQGTPGFIAPEQGHREAITPLTDIYNFGATMYWTLAHDVIPTVVPPGSVDGSVKAIPTASLRRPDPVHVVNPTVHEGLGELILQCVEPLQGDRIQSMHEVAARLQELCGACAATDDGVPLTVSRSPAALNLDI